jgi:hypothetical protein
MAAPAVIVSPVSEVLLVLRAVPLRTCCGRSAAMPSRVLAVLLCALALAGCAAGSAAPVGPAAAPMHPLLAAPPKPDCTFHEVGLGDTMPDSADAAGRKLDYERRCYRRAEMRARARLRRLQAAVAAARCDGGLPCSRPFCRWPAPFAGTTASN